MKKEILTVLVTSIGLCGVVNAACYDKTCADMGYTFTSGDCDPAGGIVKCPFDTSKVFCVKKEEGCFPGYIYYSDGTCSADVVSGKTPVGVVGYITDGGKGGFVISLYEASSLTWGPLSSLDCLQNYRTAEDAILDMNGIQNMQCIMSQNGSFPAASYCKSYKPVSSGKGSTGWYLPAAGEVKQIALYYSAINDALQRLSKTQLSSSWYWSSSEHTSGTSYYAWRVNPSNGGMVINGLKQYDYRVRCALEF